MLVGSVAIIGFGLAVVGAGAGIGYMFGQYLQASARQPESAGANRTTLFLGMTLIEALPLMAIAFGFLWDGRTGA